MLWQFFTLCQDVSYGKEIWKSLASLCPFFRFPPSRAQVSTPVFGEFVLALPLQKRNRLPLLIFDPCSNLSHHPFFSPREIGTLFMRKRAGKSQLTGQVLMKHRDQVVAASASFTGHWARRGPKGTFRRKAEGRVVPRARLCWTPAATVLKKRSQLCSWPGYGRMEPCVAEMSCEFFYNLAEC